MSCQDLAEMHDGVGMVSPHESKLDSEFPFVVSNKAVFDICSTRCLKAITILQFDPDRTVYGKSCQDYLGEGDQSVAETDVLTGLNQGQTWQVKPVRIREGQYAA
ncbi:MAG: hypothetical protein ABEI86_06245 [Halobacteriaceae archaeon]